jgi:hypothetical protein
VTGLFADLGQGEADLTKSALHLRGFHASTLRLAVRCGK